MSRKKTINIEEQVRIVQSYLCGEIGLLKATESVGIGKTTFQEWVRNYEADGVEAFLPHKQRVYSPEKKRQAVEEYLSGGGSLNELCKKYHIRSERQLRNWIKVYNAHLDFNSVKHSGGEEQRGASVE